MLAKLLLLALSASAVACATSSSIAVPRPYCVEGSTYEFRVDPSLDARQVTGLKKALDAWDADLGGKFPHEVVIVSSDDSLESCVVKVVKGPTEANKFATTMRWQNYGTQTLAAGVIVYREEWIADRLADEEFNEALPLHEAGHLLGLDHDTSREHATVMWPAITTPARIGCEDVRRACAVWGCEAACQGEGWM